MGVIFNSAMPLMSAHMVVAAYLVGGFLVASVYATGCCGADATGTTGWRSSSASRSRRSPPPCRWGSATRWRDGSSRSSRRSSPRSRWCRRPAPTCPRSSSATSTPPYQVVGGIPIPGLASILSDPGDGHLHRQIQGLDAIPAEDRPTDRRGQRHPPGLGRHGRARHAAVPADALVLGVAGSSDDGCRRADGSCARPRPPGCSSVVTLEAGWTVSEVGRQPWIVYEKMKVDDAATANTGDLGHLRRRGGPLRRARASPRSWCCAG